MTKPLNRLLDPQYMTDTEKQYRAEQMYAAYSEPKSMQEVADAYGLTRERVRQIFKEFGLPVRKRGETARAKKGAV